MIKNIVFDMGNVLVEFNPERYLAKYPDAYDVLNNEVFRSVEWLMVDCGEMTEQEAVHSISLRLPETLHQAAEDIICNWHEDIPPIPDMLELVTDLSEQGYNLYLCSNTGEKFCSFRRHIEALKFFKGEFVSANWHLLKPDENLFRAFYSHFNLVPDECIFIDDSPPNIVSALKTGMHGIVFHGDMNYLRNQLSAMRVI